MDMAYNKA